MLKLFAVILFTCKHNNGKKPASAVNSYLDLDYSGYRKNLIQ